MSLTRRELLRFAAAAGCAPGLATIATACGASSGGPATRPVTRSAALRPLLRELIDDLEGFFPVATALAVRGSRARVGLDAGERHLAHEPVNRVLLQAFDGTRWYAEEVASLATGEVVAAARQLRARGRGGSGDRRTREARPRDFTRRGEIEVRSDPERWLELLEPLLPSARSRGSSRIIYRGAFLDIEDSDTWFVGDGQDLRQSISRVRAGAVLLSWTGSEMIAEEVSRAGTGGLELAALAPQALTAVARRALTLTAGPPPDLGDGDVILAPSVAASLFRSGLAELLTGPAWHSGASRLADLAGDRIGDDRISLTDDPTLPGGYGSYAFDDEGWLSSRRPLLARGVLAAPLTCRRTARALGRLRTGHARSAVGAPAPRPSNLVVHPGDRPLASLVGDIESGYLLDGGLVAGCDPLRWRVMVRARRAREIRGGALTGRVLGPATVHADVQELLLGIRGVGAELSAFSGWPGPASSIAAPHILTRAEVSG